MTKRDTRGRFQEGHIPWHKGRTGVYSVEALDKMRSGNTGKVSARKGKTQNITPEQRKRHKEALEKLKGKNHPMYGKHHTKESKKKMREARLNKYNGENCPAWKGGITPLVERIRKCFLYRLWRSDVFTRDDFTCQKCNKRGGRLEAHHKKPFADIIEFNDIRTLQEARVCEELWNINNGITLCKKCHKVYRLEGEDVC